MPAEKQRMMQEYSRKSPNVKTSTEKQELRNSEVGKIIFGSTVVSSALEHLKQTYLVTKQSDMVRRSEEA